MRITGKSGAIYEVGKVVAAFKTYRLRLCQLSDGSGGDLLLQVATDVAHNATLERSVYMLGRLAEEAERVEAEYAKVKKEANHFLNYGLHFPEFMDTCVLDDQGGRRVNILRLRGVEELAGVMSFSQLVKKDKRRVDLRTSVWIMGKLLKILAFAHQIGVSIGDLSLQNILIDREQHYVIIFDWAKAQLLGDGMPRETIEAEVRAAAVSVIEVLNGTPEGGVPNFEKDERHKPYTDLLIELATEGRRDAFKAHSEFYKLVDGLWPRKYYPFTHYPRQDRGESE